LALYFPQVFRAIQRTYPRADSPEDTMDALSQTDRNSKRIAQLNDGLRQTFCGGQVLLTSSVAALDDTQKAQVLEAVKTFKDFREGNDPHQEHDFGEVVVDGERYFWKIDYYDLDMRYLADDPADEKHTKRVMTIMHNSEY
jgi:hypothetical protein